MWGLGRFLQTGAGDVGLGMQGGSPPGPDLVLTPPSDSGEAWAPSSSFSRFCTRTQGSERLLGLGLFTSLWGEEKSSQTAFA